jgi:putative flippase GtrA
MLASTNNRERLRSFWRGNEKLRYVALGLWNTTFAYVAYFGLYELFSLHLHYIVIGVLAHLIAVANAFVCQRVFVFRSKASWGAAFLRFSIVQFLVLIASITGLTLLVEVFHIIPLISQLVVMTSCVIAGYLLNRNFSFSVGNS